MPNLDHLLDYDLADNCLTKESSALLKTAFKEHFQTHGVPARAEEIEDEHLRRYALENQEEFGEACEEYDADAPKP